MISEVFKLGGKTALVAGDSSYWSEDGAAALGDDGADVAIADKESQKVDEAVAEVQRLGRKAVAIHTDTTKPSEVNKMVEKAVAECGKIDILVNAADLQFAKPFLEITPDEWHRVMEVNSTSVFLCCQAVGKQMLQQKKGRIINVISCQAERGVENGAAYCAAMGGVLQLTRVLDLEWARHGITVNAIGAGWMSETEKTGAPQEEFLMKYLPLRRYGHPKELGSLVVYLASDATSFFSGQFLHVDGAVMSHL